MNQIGYVTQRNMNKIDYIVQIMTSDQDDWLDMDAFRVTHTKLPEIIAFVAEQKRRHPENRYRLVVRADIEIIEVD